MSDYKAAKKAVKRGAKLLDEKHPGWYNEISVLNLNMNDSRDCILGQLYKAEHGEHGYFYEACIWYCIDQDKSEDQKLGFDVGDHPSVHDIEYGDLEKAWARKIIKRRVRYPSVS